MSWISVTIIEHICVIFRFEQTQDKTIFSILSVVIQATIRNYCLESLCIIWVIYIIAMIFMIWFLLLQMLVFLENCDNTYHDIINSNDDINGN